MEKLLATHQWGKTCKYAIEINLGDGRLVLNGRPFPFAPRQSLRKHPDQLLRHFAADLMLKDGFFYKIADSCSGNVVDVFDQLISYNQSGARDGRRRKMTTDPRTPPSAGSLSVMLVRRSKRPRPETNG